MVKKLFAIPLLLTSMVFFMKCTDDPLYQATDDQDSETTTAIGKKGGGHTEATVNNLSFPVLPADGFSITPITETKFEIPYAGLFPGLTIDEIAVLTASGPWYAQKVIGNVWQAGYKAYESQPVKFIDWGDVVEAVNPKIGRPFRLEVTLYVDISEVLDESLVQLKGYTMDLLEYPSSLNEVQGTNTTTYDANWATVVSSKPTLIIQYIQGADLMNLQWNGSEWWVPDETTEDPIDGTTFNKIPIVFAPELNVGGKYIYGASSGGWKPTIAGLYRLTFSLPEESSINLSNAVIGNYDGNTALSWGEPEFSASHPQVNGQDNLTYVDVTVVAGGGGGGRQ